MQLYGYHVSLHSIDESCIAASWYTTPSCPGSGGLEPGFGAENPNLQETWPCLAALMEGCYTCGVVVGTGDSVWGMSTIHLTPHRYSGKRHF